MAKQNKFDEAIKSMNIAAGLDPESPFIALNLSGMYSVTGDKEKSIKYFKKAFQRLGEQIVPISYDPTLNNIREEPEFKRIIEDVTNRKKSALEQPGR
jgi:tetratricopeptide (TPR) repeat protein